MKLNRSASAIAPIVAVLWLIVPMEAAAQSSSNNSGNAIVTLTLEQLGNLDVTIVSKEPEPIRRTPAAVTVITQEDLRRSGATTLPEALKMAPGVAVARIDSDHWSVGIRGFGDQFSKSVLVMIDGRSVYTPLFAGIQWAVQDTVLDDIERIEVVRGPGGTVWGANAVNGVVNIITKHAADTYGGLVSVGGGNLDHAIASFRYGGGRGDAFSYRVQGKGFMRGPELHPNALKPAFDDWRMGQLGFRADWQLDSADLTVSGDIYSGRDGQSVSLGQFSPPSQLVSYSPFDVSGGNVLAHWRRLLKSGGDIRFQGYYDRTNLLGPQLGETRHTLNADLIHRPGGVGRHNLLWGLGARISPSDISQTVQTLDITPHRQTDSVYSAFVQDELSLVSDGLWLTLGSKIERNNYTGVEVQPSARLLWTPSNRQSLWTAFSRAVRTPSRLEEDFQLTGLLTPSPPTFVRIQGNHDFVSEELLGLEAGYRSVVTDRLYVDLTVFHNDHDKLQSLGAPSIVAETTPPPAHLLLVFPYANGVRGTSTGFEVAPDWKPTAWGQIKASYSYLGIDLENVPGHTDTSAVSSYEGSSPRHQLALRGLLELSQGVELDPTFRYVSALAGRNVDSFGTFDLRVGWRTIPGLDVSVTVQSLFQSDHVEFAHDPPPPVALKRSVYASIVWRR